MCSLVYDWSPVGIAACCNEYLHEVAFVVALLSIALILVILSALFFSCVIENDALNRGSMVSIHIILLCLLCSQVNISRPEKNKQTMNKNRERTHRYIV